MHPIILFIIKSYDLVDTNVFENVDIFPRVLSISVLRILLFNRSHECHKLSRNDPVKITVLNTFIVFVLLHIEGPEIVPSKSYCKLESLQTMEECAIVEALTLGCIPVVSQYGMIRLKLSISILCFHLENDNHECAHQESTIDDFISWIGRRTVMKYLILLEVFVSEETGEFP